VTDRRRIINKNNHVLNRESAFLDLRSHLTFLKTRLFEDITRRKENSKKIDKMSKLITIKTSDNIRHERQSRNDSRDNINKNEISDIRTNNIEKKHVKRL
jgi:hypothetical protein